LVRNKSHGLEGVCQKFITHISIAKSTEKLILTYAELEILALGNFNIICFQFFTEKLGLDDVNRVNETWMNSVNGTDLALFYPIKLDDKYVIRWVIGQRNVTENIFKIPEVYFLKSSKKQKKNSLISHGKANQNEFYAHT